MILGFKDRFEPYVLDGSKTHSIRAGKRWEVGMRADCYVRPRQKGMRLLYRATVVRVDPISIWLRPPQARLYADERVFAGALGIAVCDTVLSDDEANLLAWQDGFRSRPCERGGPLDALAEMAMFWLPVYRLEEKPFHGQLIHWDYKKRFTQLPKKKPTA